jgi:methyltransferase (TIGR00027 family)
MVVGGLSATAIGLAAMRAVESRRPDRLFDDPYADGFVQAARAALPAASPEREQLLGRTELGALLYNLAVVRTHFFDNFLLGATHTGRPQVVLLAAGLDTRAFRLAWPQSARVFELDLPEMLAFKRRVLTERAAQPLCARTTVAVDLRTEWPGRLLRAGFQRSVPTVWLAEGLLTYLSAQEAGSLLESVGTLSATGSQLAVEYASQPDDPVIDRARALPDPSGWITRLKGGLSQHTPRWLADHGWYCTLYPGALLGARYNRNLEAASVCAFLTATYGGAATRGGIKTAGDQPATTADTDR